MGFADYIQKWHDRLTIVSTRLDNTVPQVNDKILKGLKNLVNEEITFKVINMCDRTECHFLKKAYKDFVAGLCYKGVVGFRFVARAYVGNGIVCILFVLLMYCMWRHAVDNRNAWKQTLKLPSQIVSMTEVVPTAPCASNQYPEPPDDKPSVVMAW